MQLLLAFGANISGPWGRPGATLRRALAFLHRHGIRVIRVSPPYATAPVSPIPQPPFLNLVALAETRLGAEDVLALLKSVEKRAGRRKGGPRLAARPLDIDILDLGRRTHGKASKFPVRGRIELPHPLLAERSFVLAPLADLLPGWRHPRLQRRAEALLAARPSEERLACHRLVPRLASWHTDPLTRPNIRKIGEEPRPGE